MLTWSVMPYEIKDLILQRLDFARDILHAGITSKDTYAILTDDNCLPSDDTSAKDAFSNLALRSVQAHGKDLTGAWTTNIQYWKPCTIQHSISDQVLTLDSVWWFEVTASFSVPSGRYRPYFRIAYDYRNFGYSFQALHLENLKFQVQFDDASDVESAKILAEFDEICTLPSHTWVRLYLPEVVVSPSHAFETVKCSITDTASTYKRQFCVDVIGLERILRRRFEDKNDRDAMLVKLEEEFHPV
ncbi:hypothetical protein HDU81_006224 [Chytriomyces hyalinus]|nr:hypothetical protein HDU81_006224 [Chytriomyces hyalinus]